MKKYINHEGNIVDLTHDVVEISEMNIKNFGHSFRVDVYDGQENFVGKEYFKKYPNDNQIMFCIMKYCKPSKYSTQYGNAEVHKIYSMAY